MFIKIVVAGAIALTPVMAMADPVRPPASNMCSTFLNQVDRGTIGNSSCSLGPNQIDLEAGYQNISSRRGGNVVAYPNAVLRVGTKLKNLEFDLVTPSEVKANAFGQHGTSDIAYGLKYQLGASKHLSYAADVLFTAPTGTRGISAGGSNVIGGLNAAYSIVRGLTLSANAKFIGNSNGITKYGSFRPSVELAAAVLPSTQLFVEGAELTNSSGPDTNVRRFYDVGARHQILDNVLLDVEYGRSPSPAFGSYRYTGFGISVLR